MVKVTVVVAVYNPGDDIRELLESIDAQSLPPAEFEVIFSDDDSTDGTRERLIGWAESRPHVRVLHNTPNSGWPGRPRNLAIDAAKGEFLFFADNDDKFAPQALEWMYDFATEHDADVVVAKEAGVGSGRAVNRELFRENIPDARLGRDPILAILTPHKLFRTALLREHGIRSPEGRVRLEDHFVVVSCYFAARRISVLADRVCYYWMRRVSDRKNASLAAYDPVIYFRAVARTLEVVEANTEPGPLRDQLYAHWYEKKMLSALRGHALLNKSASYQEALVRELRRVSERFGLGEAQWPWMGAGARLRSHLLTHGTLEEIKVLAAAEPGVTARIRLDEVAWTDDDQLVVRVRAELVYADGQPVRFVRDGDTVRWDIVDRVPELDLPAIDMADLLSQIRLDVLLAERDTLGIELAPGISERIEGEAVTARAEATIDARRLTETFRDRTVLDVRALFRAAGWAPERRVPADRALPKARVVAGMRVRPYATMDTDNLSIELRPQAPDAPAGRRAPRAVGPRARSIAARLVRRARRLLGRASRRVRQS